MHARNHAVSLRKIQVETTHAKTLLEVFQAALAQEEQVSKQIDTLYETAMHEKDFAAVVEMQWFVTEQVEEEKSARDIIAKLERAGSDPPALLEIDRELAARAAGEGDWKKPGSGRRGGHGH